jgi:hypothetical protein
LEDLEDLISVKEVYDDDETFWMSYQAGIGSYSIRLSKELTEKMKGTSSLKMVVGLGNYAIIGIRHDYSPPVDWCGKEFIGFYWYGVNNGVTWRLHIASQEGYREYFFKDNFSGWRYIIKKIDNPSKSSGTLNLSAIVTVAIYTTTPSIGITYLDNFHLLDLALLRSGNSTPRLVLCEGTRTYFQIMVEAEQPSPIFIVLWDSYDSGWTAKIDGKTLKHFRAFNWANGFYINGSGTMRIEIFYEPQRSKVIVISIWSLSWLTTLLWTFYSSRACLDKITEKLRRSLFYKRPQLLKKT